MGVHLRAEAFYWAKNNYSGARIACHFHLLYPDWIEKKVVAAGIPPACHAVFRVLVSSCLSSVASKVLRWPLFSLSHMLPACGRKISFCRVLQRGNLVGGMEIFSKDFSFSPRFLFQFTGDDST